MSKRVITIVTVLAAVAAVVVPILLSVYLAAREGRQAEAREVDAQARNVLRRVDTISDQFLAGVNSLVAAHDPDPCSKQNLTLMRRIDVASSYIQAIGRMSGNRMVCSSLGTARGPGIALGPVDVVQRSGTAIRTDVTLPFAPDITFVVTELHGYAAILHKDLVLDVTSGAGTVSVVVFSVSTGHILLSRGAVGSSWTRPSRSDSRRFVEDNALVSVVRSRKYDLGVVVAEPTAALASRARTASLVLVPVGVVAGLALALSVLWLARARLAIPAVLRTALRRQEFFLAYQPVVDLRTGACAGAEALLRWQRKDGELVPPDQFVANAEGAGLMQEFTTRVVQLVTEEATGVFTRLPDFHLAINLSPEDLHQPRTVGLVQRLCAATGAGPGNLIVEATERGFTDPERARDIVRQLRANGVGLAIDDFGTGYSSLSFLQSFELDYLKIDKSFVNTIGTDAATSHVVHHIIEMAKALGLQLVAEGVETQEQADFLRERGVQYGQGWLFGKPMTFAELMERVPATAARTLS